MLSLVLALLAGHVSDRAAQRTVVVTGTVTDATTGTPLTGARVRVEGLGISAPTLSNGHYTVSLPTLIGSLVVIRAEHVGYGSMTQRLRLDTEAYRLDFALMPSTADRPVDETEATEFKDICSRADATVVSQVAFAPAVLREQSRRSLVSGGRYNQNFEREGYERIYDNEFMAAGTNPLSTFSIDVDQASYANVRRFIREGRLPPPDAVRIEELINYFTYDLPSPEGPDPFSVHSEVGRAPWNPAHRLVRIGIQGRTVDTEDLAASNLVFLLDVSGSMNSPNKLPLLKSALRLLVDQLRPQDQVAIVVYAGAAGVVLDPTSGGDKERILDALSRLEAGGSTAGGAGLQLAYDVARRNHLEGGNNRVILATDGDFNIGPSSDAAMVRLIEARRDEGTFLTVLGFGTGNLQDAKMEKLADHGNGNFAYIDTALEAHKVLVSEFGGTLYTIAKDVKIQVEFNPIHVQAYRLIGYENRLLAAEDFNDDRKDAGDLGAGHTVTALYEVIPVGVEAGTLMRDRGIDDLRYQDDGARIAAGESPELLFIKLRYKDPDERRSRLLTHPVLDTEQDPSVDFTFAASVAAFGMVLRDSKYGGSTDLETVLRWARRSVGSDLEGYRKEFVRMVEAARQLSAEGI
jgi:Ca-activated chloride channel family protein